MSETATKQKSDPPPFEKEVIRLPDGRELTYYRFPAEASRPAPGKAPNAPAHGEER